MSLCRQQSTATDFAPRRQESVLDRQNRLKTVQPSELAESKKFDDYPEPTLQVEARDWTKIEQAYNAWWTSVFIDSSTPVPTNRQSEILHLIHLRRTYEHFLEQGLTLPPHLGKHFYFKDSFSMTGKTPPSRKSLRFSFFVISR